MTIVVVLRVIFFNSGIPQSDSGNGYQVATAKVFRVKILKSELCLSEGGGSDGGFGGCDDVMAHFS